MLCNVIPIPVPQTITWLSRHAQLFHPLELPQPGSRAPGGDLDLAPHVVGAVYKAKVDYAARHNGQEPPPDVVSKLTTGREKSSLRLFSGLGADWVCTRSPQRVRTFHAPVR